MGCTASTSFSIKARTVMQDKNLPTSALTGSEILTFKNMTRFNSIKFNPSIKSVTDAPNAKIIEKALLPKDISFILKVLHDHFLFKDLDEEIKSQTIRSMKYFKLNDKDEIYKQGDYGNYLFIVVKGTVLVHSKENVLISKVIKGGMIGEAAIIYNTQRPDTATCEGVTELWGLERNLFKVALKTVALKQYHENKCLLEKCELFNMFDSATRNKILEFLAVQIFHNEIIIREGEIGENVYIIKSGKVKCSINGEVIKELAEYDYFGEQSLLNNNIRTATVTAIDTVTVICVGRNDLENVFDSDYLKIVFKNSQRISMSKDRILNRLTLLQIEKIIENTEMHKYKAGQFLQKKGKNIKKIVIALKGSVMRDGVELEKYKCIGTETLLGIGISDANYIANEFVECAEISKNTLEAIISGNYSEIVLQNDLVKLLGNIPLLSNLGEESLRKIARSCQIVEYEDGEIIFNQDSCGHEFYIVNSGEVIITIDGEYVRTLIKDSYFGEKSLILNEPRTASVISNGKSSLFVMTQETFNDIVDAQIREQLISRMHLQDYSIELSDLSIIKKIGKGMFGNVFLVAHQKTKILYALKVISNADIKRLKIKKNIHSSEETLLQLESHFIVKLIKTISDDSRVYFLLEYIPGITLYKLILDHRPISYCQIVFYISNIILMIKHLHSRNIVHRDLKPENIMVDQSGYLKLIDFDTATKVEDRCYTLAGTPHYMAPEMIRGNGYHLSVDYWSLGVILYELVYDYLPFGDHCEEPLEIYHEILTAKVDYRNKYRVYQKAIEILLEPNPGKRADFQKLTQNEIFSEVKWDLLAQRKIPPLFIPPIPKENYKIVSEFRIDLIIEEENKRMPKISIQECE